MSGFVKRALVRWLAPEIAGLIFPSEAEVRARLDRLRGDMNRHLAAARAEVRPPPPPFDRVRFEPDKDAYREVLSQLRSSGDARPLVEIERDYLANWQPVFAETSGWGLLASTPTGAMKVVTVDDVDTINSWRRRAATFKAILTYVQGRAQNQANSQVATDE